VILKYALTSEEYVESRRAYRIWMARRRLLFRNLYVLAALSIVAATRLLFSGTKWWALLLYIAGLGLILERALLWRLRAERSPRGPVQSGEPIELGADGDSVGWNSPSGRGDVRWANIEGCHETRNLVLLQIPSGDALAIPKRAFSPGEYSRFKELLRKELIVKITRESSDALLLKFVVTWGVVAIFVMALGVGYLHNFLMRLPRAPQPNRQGRATTINRPDKSPTASPGQLRGRGSVYLVPVGPTKSGSSLATLVKDYSRKYKTSIALLPSIPLPRWGENAARKQYVAEDLITAMQAGYPKLAAAPEAILIGVTDADMYISALKWDYAFSYRDEERFAIISTAHLAEDEDGKTQGDDVMERRLRKVLARDVGSLHFRLQPSQDFRSIMYESLGDAAELDDLGDDYLESDVEVRADLHVEQGDPCFVLREYTQPERAHPEHGAVRNHAGRFALWAGFRPAYGFFDRRPDSPRTDSRVAYPGHALSRVRNWRQPQSQYLFGRRQVALHLDRSCTGARRARTFSAFQLGLRLLGRSVSEPRSKAK
jgi:predicted Zn-dependent protease